MESNHRLNPDACRVDDLRAIVAAGRDEPPPPLAARLERGIPVYDCRRLQPFAPDLLAEWHAVLSDGAGVLVLEQAWPDAAVVDAASAAFFAMIESERASGGGGDHFAKAGANGRVWNALQKLALRDPTTFVRYYGNAFLAAVCTAWLGPAYQVTSQVNCVYPGGAAQTPHRDYHLGFCTAPQAAAYPVSVHRLSPHLTLQGAVAHVDMPIESGPTMLLPHSQKYLGGYLVAAREVFAQAFAEWHVQLPLKRGDAVFFNPALLHAAGTNRSADIERMANLLQVSSAFGRAMESVDRVAMSRAIYPALLDVVDADAAAHAIAACAEGYAFPTNLDLDPPLGGLAPDSHQVLMQRALAERWPPGRFADALVERAAKQRA